MRSTLLAAALLIAVSAPVHGPPEVQEIVRAVRDYLKAAVGVSTFAPL